MKCSVLMSVYAKENPLRFDRALQSNLDDQTHKPEQFVLVCDGPLTEELNAVIGKYRRRYPSVMKICRLKKNVGLGRALNAGLKHCDHEWIIRSDSDDVCVPDRFHKQLSFMSDHPEIAASSGAIDEFQSDYTKPFRVKHMPQSHEDLLNYAKHRNPLNHMAVIFRKRDVLDAGSYQHLPYMEDYFLWIRLVADGKRLGNLDDILVHACVGNGMSRRRGDLQTIRSKIILDRYMIRHGLLSRRRHLLNLAEISALCLVPEQIRNLIYQKLLRAGKESV